MNHPLIYNLCEHCNKNYILEWNYELARPDHDTLENRAERYLV